VASTGEQLVARAVFGLLFPHLSVQDFGLREDGTDDAHRRTVNKQRFHAL
jgi:hypothetical protein